MIDLEKDVDKREKINCKDFPPTWEDEQIKMWDNAKLNLDKKDVELSEKEKKWSMDIHLEEEEFHEIRIYPMKNFRMPEKAIEEIFKSMKNDGIDEKEIEKMRKAYNNPTDAEYLEGFDLKIISKINNKTNKITVMMKGNSLLSDKKEMTKDEYNQFVSGFEMMPGAHMIYDINSVRILDKSYFKNMMKNSGMEDKIKKK